MAERGDLELDHRELLTVHLLGVLGGEGGAGDPLVPGRRVDEQDLVWVSDFGGNAMHRFDPTTERFDTFDLPSSPGNVRQILGRSGEVWGAESAADQLVVIRPTG